MMKYRKITINLLVGLLLPIALVISWFTNIYGTFFKGVYRYYDFRIDSLGEFLYHVYGRYYFVAYFIHLFVLFSPLQLIKDYYYKTKRVRLSFLIKWAILTMMLTGWMVLWIPFGFFNLTYFLFVIGFDLVFTTLLYWTIDRYTEKQCNRINTANNANVANSKEPC